MSRYFEEFQVGQRFVHPIRRTVIDMDNMLFAALTYNPAAVHIDYECAAKTEFGKPLVNSSFTLGLMVGISIHDTTLGTTVANLGMSETAFPKPVFIAPAIAWLVHENCKSTGEIYVMLAGRVARAFVAETVGVFREHWTIEQVAEQFGEIESAKNLKVFPPYPSGFMDHLEYSFEMNPPNRP